MCKPSPIARALGVRKAWHHAIRQHAPTPGHRWADWKQLICNFLWHLIAYKTTEKAEFVERKQMRNFLVRPSHLALYSICSRDCTRAQFRDTRSTYIRCGLVSRHFSVSYLTLKLLAPLVEGTPCQKGQKNPRGISFVSITFQNFRNNLIFMKSCALLTSSHTRATFVNGNQELSG